MIIELKPVETLATITVGAKFGNDTTYMAEYNGETYIGKFVNKSVGEQPELESWNFIWNGSIFPQGIPWECLDRVWTVNYLS